MGTKADDNHYVILVDVDNKNGTVDERLDLLTHHQTTTNFKLQPLSQEMMAYQWIYISSYSIRIQP